MYLAKENLKHINTITHESKVVVFATDGGGKVFYTVKQDGFEESYLNTPADLRTGWEGWQLLEFPDEEDDLSVTEKEKSELTHQENTSKYFFRSIYRSKQLTAIAPIQAISALDHLYVFRQSTNGTLLVDRFVLDGMTNKMNRKLEVRFKRSRQKHTPTKNMQRAGSGLVDVDTLDFRDTNGNLFYEPTTELSLVSNLYNGWFSVVLVPTIENDVYRWHIFSYNSEAKKIESTCIRASKDGLFDANDYTVFEESGDSLLPRKIPGVIRRTLEIDELTITNGLSATKYDIQKAQQIQSGEEQLLRTVTRIMLAIPTDQATAAFSFAIASDGTLGEIDENPSTKILRSKQREVLLPLNTLDEVKAIGDRTPPPQGIISAIAEGTKAENIETLVKITTDRGAAGLVNTDRVKISGTKEYQGLHKVVRVDQNSFDIDIPVQPGLGYWEKEEDEAGGLIFDGMVTAFQKTADGKLSVRCADHGLETGDHVQIIGSENYNDTFPIQRIDDTHFVIERKWAMAEAVNVRLVSLKRRGVVFNGSDDYVKIPYAESLNPKQFTISFWAKVTGGQGACRSLVASRSAALFTGFGIYASKSNKWEVLLGDGKQQWATIGGKDVILDVWTHVACSYDGQTIKLYLNGVLSGSLASTYAPNLSEPLYIGVDSTNPTGKTNQTESFFHGHIAGLCIWNLAHEASTIRDNMFLEFTGKELGMAGYWRLGGISEKKVIDFSVNRNDGSVYGDPFVSAATLNRKLVGGTTAVKYSNPELFAVSERATYEESFEFKVNAEKSVDLPYLNNADGKKAGTKIFTLSYWGKASRSAKEIKTIPAVQNKFEELGHGWYRASCSVTIPDGVSLLRSFEMTNVQGEWKSIEIRKHRIHCLSNSITEAKYSDNVSLSSLLIDYKTSTAELKALDTKNEQLSLLLQQKCDLEEKIFVYENQATTRAEMKKLNEIVARLREEEKTLSSEYERQKDNPFNYNCRIVTMSQTPNMSASLKDLGISRMSLDWDRGSSYENAIIRSIGDEDESHHWKFVPIGENKYYIINQKFPGYRLAACGLSNQDKFYLSVILRRIGNEDKYHEWKLVPKGNNRYNIVNIPYPDLKLGVELMFNEKHYPDAILKPGDDNSHLWEIIPLQGQSDKAITKAHQSWQNKIQELSTVEDQLERIKASLVATDTDKAGWDKSLAEVSSLLTELQTEITTLPTSQIPEQKSSESISLASLKEDYVLSTAKLRTFETKEKQILVLLHEKHELDDSISAYDNQKTIREEIDNLQIQIPKLIEEEKILAATYEKYRKDPFNFYFRIVTTYEASWNKSLKDLAVSNLSSGSFYNVVIRESDSEDLKHKWKFVALGAGEYYIINKEYPQMRLARIYNDQEKSSLSFIVVIGPPERTSILDKWKLNSLGDEKYHLKDAPAVLGLLGVKGMTLGGNYCLSAVLRMYGDDPSSQIWKLIQLDDFATDEISAAYKSWQNKVQQIGLSKERLEKLKALLTATPQDKANWLARLNYVIASITWLQTELNTLNSVFLAGIRKAQSTAQSMSLVAKDRKGLLTQAALLGFVQPASRLHAIETCEGNVQLSYFDREGRMRQTLFDATADGKNSTFEQWLPDGQRACLKLTNAKSVVTPNQALYLPGDWSIEAWFVYPLPETELYNTLVSGKAGHHVLVKDRNRLGIWLGTALQSQKYFDSGFDLDQLSQGWHHLAAVGKGDTTLFYIDGKKVGNTKEKAIMDAEKNLISNPNDTACQQKLEEIKSSSFKVEDVVQTIGNSRGGQPFGQMTEVRIWSFALSDEEITVNSKTLLSGNEPGLLAYYPMNEAAGEEIRDFSGNGNNATVTGAIWWICMAPIGKSANTVLSFDGINDYIKTSAQCPAGDEITIEYWFKGSSLQSAVGQADGSGNYIITGLNGLHVISTDGGIKNGIKLGDEATNGCWHHIAMTWKRNTLNGFVSYLDGVQVARRATGDKPLPAFGMDNSILFGYFFGNVIDGEASNNKYLKGQLSEVRIWKKARSQKEIQADLYNRLTGKEPDLVAYYPLNAIKSEDNTRQVLDLAGGKHGIVFEASAIDDNALSLPVTIVSDAVVSAEYSMVTMGPGGTNKIAIMRRFFAYPSNNGVTLLPDQRVENLELKWIGNGQFAPTLLGYIEGPPPVPSENLTLSEDYNNATSVELTMSEDVEFSWDRSQDVGLGATAELFVGANAQTSAGLGFMTTVATMRAGIKGNLDYNYQFQNRSHIKSSSSLNLTDKIELRGTVELTPNFPHLGNRFIPKNVGYALVVSSISDVFVTRLARSRRMVGYKVMPVDGVPPDINTITFLINPAYTMNGSLDGMTGSYATSARYFKHIPEMRMQYGSLYPASYYRLQEAYELKGQIEAEDKRRESYFSNFDVRTVDETSLNRNIDSGVGPSNIGVYRQEDKTSSTMTEEQKQASAAAKLSNIQADANLNVDKQTQLAKARQAEIQHKITDQERQVHATESFAAWQKRMESIQIRAAKRNIVNTYVWDADGGLRTEQQSFANTVEHVIGGSFSLDASLGGEAKFGAIATAELTAQATVNLTQTMNKTESRSKGFELKVDLSGLEYRGITNYNDNPILPGEKVDRYRFMSFYLEASTSNFQDFFTYVVDPEWLRSNDEEARALRQTQAGKPNKAWRVLHRVTFVERPALMGFGKDARSPLQAMAAVSENQNLLDKISKIEEELKLIREKMK